MLSKRLSPNTSNVLSVIMGGGQGTRLFPLTKDRSKPAVPLAGKYRLVDIPISNCINSDLKRVYLLTQFNSASLHRHISQSYKFDHFSGGFVEILAAEQTFTDTSWYQGTADAVRKNLNHLLNHDFDYCLILSGDQLYRMDFRRIIAQHMETYADLTIATIPVVRQEAQSLGIMEINGEKRITRFVEKPKDPAVLDSLKLDPASYPKLGIEGEEEFYLASMASISSTATCSCACSTTPWPISASTSSRWPFRTSASSPTSSRVTGRTSGPSPPFSTPTSM